jgi:transposase-like protein
VSHFINAAVSDPPQAACARDKWYFDEVVLKIAGVTHWLWRAVDRTGIVLVQSPATRRRRSACCASF